MKTRIDEISKRKKMYYSYKELLELSSELNNISFSKLKDKSEPPVYPILDEDTIKRIVKNFYISYFGQDFEVMSKLDDNHFEIKNVFDVPIIREGTISHISMFNYFINDKILMTSIENIHLKEKNDITTAIEYAHEIGHALVERNKTIDDIFEQETISILLELLFAFDIDSDPSLFEGDIIKYNIYNPYSKHNTVSLDPEDEYNYETTRRIISYRLNILEAMKQEYDKVKDEEVLSLYSKCYNSTITAFKLFESYLDGNINVLSNLDDILKGKINITDMINNINSDKKREII